MYRYSGKLSDDFINQAVSAFDKYKADKQGLVDRVRRNMAEYKSEYWTLYDESENATKPKTAYMLSAVENKYGDYIDNFPTANFLPREENDEGVAKALTKIIPVQLELSDFKAAYKKNIRQKMICGTAIYGVFYNPFAEEIEVKAIDFLNVFCDMNVLDVQESQFLFVTKVIPNTVLEEEYPECKELFESGAEVESYNTSRKVEDSTELIDCYYKKDGRVHLAKLINGNVIDSTEDRDEYKDGLYNHGLYPIVFDNMYPEPDSPFGFGLIDTAINAQMYVDRLDGALLKNAFLAAKPKWLVSKNSGVNIEELTDAGSDVVEAVNIGEENIRKIELAAVDNSVVAYRNRKIEELKEITASRDVQTGGTSNGVTAASAITALQEAGDKKSRAMIDDSYDAYKKVVKLVIELIRQFFDKDRVFRITNEDGSREYEKFSREQLYSPEPVYDALGMVIDTKYRKVEFDIDIVPQRQNVYRRETNNQTIMALWNGGFFNPQNLDISLIALEAFSFEGKDTIINKLQELAASQKQAAMTQTGGAQIEMDNGISDIDGGLTEGFADLV